MTESYRSSIRYIEERPWKLRSLFSNSTKFGFFQEYCPVISDSNFVLWILVGTLPEEMHITTQCWR